MDYLRETYIELKMKLSTFRCISEVKPAAAAMFSIRWIRVPVVSVALE